MTAREPLVSIVIPCYNERVSIEEVIRRVREAPLPGLRREIIVVDDGSRDGSAEALAGIAGVRVLRHERNRGKGAAVKTGFAASRGDVLLIQDADLEYDPRDIAAVVGPIVSGRADAVMGSRFVNERPRFFFGPRRSPFFTHYIGNLTIVTLTNLLYGQEATDYEGAYKAFRAESVRDLRVQTDGFAFDNELICKLLRRGVRLVEVPIRYEPRRYEDGKKIAWRDGVVMVWTIVKWRLFPV